MPRYKAVFIPPLQSTNQHTNYCRLCFCEIQPQDQINSLFDNEMMTPLGKKLQFLITGIGKLTTNRSNYCCKECVISVDSCFNQLVQIQTSVNILEQIDSNTTLRNKNINVTTLIFTCYECQQDVRGLNTYTKHITNHLIEQQPESCDNKTLNIEQNWKSLEEHDYYEDINKKLLPDIKLEKEDETLTTIEDENEIDMITCFKCEGIFVDKSELQTHLQQHDILLINNSEECKAEKVVDKVLEKVDVVNEKTVKKVNKKRRKVKKAILSNKVCRYCQEALPRLNIMKHMKICKKKFIDKHDFLCSDCGVKCTSLIEYNAHRKNHLNEISASKGGTCAKCKKYFKRRRTLLKHVPCWTEKVLCDVCGVPVSQRSMTQHKLRHGNKTKSCPVCHKKFYVDNILEKHILKHKDVDMMCKQECRRCSEQFQTLSQYLLHLEDVHKVTVQKKDEKAMRRCQLCNMHFLYESHLRTHLFTAHDDDNVLCYVTCHRCHITFSILREYKHHMTTVHLFNGEINKRRKKFECCLCSKSFLMEFGLNEHLLTHPDTENIEFSQTCRKCVLHFTSLSSFQQHLKIVHDFNKKLKDCHFCSCSFRTESTLLSHLKDIHDLVEAESCTYCDDNFATRAELRLHMKLYHNVPDKDLPLLKVVRPKPKCNECGEKLKSGISLSRHLNEVHGIEKKSSRSVPPTVVFI